MAHIFNDDNFKADVIDNEGVVMVDFWATWCGPCQALAPVISELASDYEGKALVGKYNVEEDNVFAGQFNIMSIPAVKFFKGGELVGEIVGLRDKSDYEAKLNELLG